MSKGKKAAEVVEPVAAPVVKLSGFVLSFLIWHRVTVSPMGRC
jgi:hypothetical protein